MPGNNDFYSGIGYVWRIRDPTTSDNPHTQTDLFHALVYVAPKEGLSGLPGNEDGYWGGQQACSLHQTVGHNQQEGLHLGSG